MGRFIVFLLLSFGLVGVGVIFDVFENQETVSEAHEAFELINDIRREVGLPILAWDGELEQLAIKHSRFMKDTKQFEHSDYNLVENILTTTTTVNGIIDLGIASFPDGKSIVEPWRDSPGHYANIVNNDIRFGAIGVVDNYATFLAR
ncbi:CAP domain-containing protein [Chloroflexota bacterium]